MSHAQLLRWVPLWVHYFAQGHFSIQSGRATDCTTDVPIGGEPTLPLKPHPNRKPKAIRTLLNNTNFEIKLVGFTVKYWQRGLQHFTFKLYSDHTVIYFTFFFLNCC